MNLWITGGTPNLPLIGAPSVFSPFVAADYSNQFWVQPLIIAGFVVLAKVILDWFFNTKSGLAMRATGVNARMAKAQGVATSKNDFARHGDFQCADCFGWRPVCTNHRQRRFGQWYVI